VKRVLIAEDELSTRALYEQVLLQLGHMVRCVRNGSEALASFEEMRPDLVVLDVKMPEMHGFEALERIREIDPDVPVIICSAYPKLRNDPSIITMKVFDFIDKPIDINILRKRVQEALAQREAQTGEAGKETDSRQGPGESVKGGCSNGPKRDELWRTR